MGPDVSEMVPEDGVALHAARETPNAPRITAARKSGREIFPRERRIARPVDESWVFIDPPPSGVQAVAILLP
jgi:hypothetical protein